MPQLSGTSRRGNLRWINSVRVTRPCQPMPVITRPRRPPPGRRGVSTIGALHVAVDAQRVETALAARQGTAALAAWAVLMPVVLRLSQMSAGAMGGGVVSAVAHALGMSLAAVPLPRAVAGPDSAVQGGPYAWRLLGIGEVRAWKANALDSVLRGGGRRPRVAGILSQRVRPAVRCAAGAAVNPAASPSAAPASRWPAAAHPS